MKLTQYLEKYRRKDFLRGDIYVWLGYIPKRDDHDRPMMDERELGLVMLRALDLPKANHGERVPKVTVGLSEAWKYGIDSYVARTARQHAQMLFGDVTVFSMHRIADLMNDMLIELCTLKPEREDERPASELSVLPDGSFRLDVAEPELQ